MFTKSRLLGVKPVLVRTVVVLQTLFTCGLVAADSGPRIVLFSLSAPADQMRAFEDGLETRGLVHPSSIELTHITADGRHDALSGLAVQAVSLSPQVIVAVGGKAAVAARDASDKIPIVAVTGDMESVGLVNNFSQPEGNVTGFSFFSVELAAKRMELLLGLNPLLRRLKVLMPANRHGTQTEVISLLDATLEGRGIEIEVLSVSQFEEVEAVIEGIGASPEVSLYIHPSVHFDSRAREIGDLLAKHRVIAMTPWKEYVEAGGLVSYSPDIIEIWRQASTYVDRILRGAKPRELPVSLPTKFELVINLRAAQDLGVHIPASLLLRADHVID